MADVFSKRKRSEVMARIRGRGNKATELALVSFFRAQRITGWRRQTEVRIQNSEVRNFSARPDFVFKKLKLAVFVDGCFWHGCPRHATKPKNHRTFWQRKLSANKSRDALVTRTLRRAGWRVLRVWEHELTSKNAARLARRLSAAISG